MVILFRIIIFLIVALIEWYFYQGISTIIKDMPELKRNIFRYTYFFFVLCIMGGVIAASFLPPPLWSKPWRYYFGSAVFIILLCQVIGTIPLIIDDLIRLFSLIYQKLFTSQVADDGGTKISRIKFFSYLSASLAFIPAVGFIYGIVRGGKKFRVHRTQLYFPNLPDSFHGFKIVHLSDIHTGSFIDTSNLETAFERVKKENADVIFFTGDLVNNESKETDGFIDTYRKLQAPHGVYSVFGNHDYGDYVDWESDEAKAANHAALRKVHADSGWKLLMNESTTIKKGEDEIALLGVENCPFRGSFVRHRYGDLKKTYEGAKDYPFKILLSHDPSHWDKQVSVEEQFSDIDLTLSGHTHGMQFGIDIPGLRWSPVKYLYKQWAGLYKSKNQYLYVNRGLGFIGYNGRLGIWPEITVIELFKGPKTSFET
jgi:uncharacterized protein